MGRQIAFLRLVSCRIYDGFTMAMLDMCIFFFQYRITVCYNCSALERCAPRSRRAIPMKDLFKPAKPYVCEEDAEGEESLFVGTWF